MTKQKSPSCLATCLHTVANAQAARQRDKTDISVSGGEVWVCVTLYLAFADVYLYVCVYTLVTIVNGVCTLYFAGVYEYQG